MLLSLTVFYLFEHLHGYIAVAEQLVERATLHRLHNLTSTGPALHIARRTYDETIVTNFVCCPSFHCFIRRRHNALTALEEALKYVGTAEIAGYVGNSFYSGGRRAI
jgi:N-acetyl-anhydromuramyl-L-alanine amidase AmpD